MKAKTIQVLWHGKDPVFSVDFHPTTGMLATGGGDKEIKFWKVGAGEDGAPTVEHLASLEGHARTVNCVRFSPTGESLASGGDGGEVVVWKPVDKSQPAWIGEEDAGEHAWKPSTLLRGHSDDVQDLAWAPDSTALLTGSVENSCIIWDMAKGKIASRMEDHNHFVQGVAWDPAGRYVVSQSADRTCRVYAPRPSKKIDQNGPLNARARDMLCEKVMCKRDVEPGAAAEAPAADGEGGGKAAGVMRSFLFNDENMVSFFRRPAWSPDGSFLIVPAGMHKRTADSQVTNSAYVYARGVFARPALHLPVSSKAAVCARFCPIPFRKSPEAAGEGARFDLPYRLVFAVATIDSVLVYDTQAPAPIAIISGMHFAAITDLAWAPDGRHLAISSRDGYCTLASFGEGELGTPVPGEELPEHFRNMLNPENRLLTKEKEGKEGKKEGAGAGGGAVPAPAVLVVGVGKRAAEGGAAAAPAPKRVSLAPQAVGEGPKRVTIQPQFVGGGGGGAAAAPAEGPKRVTLAPQVLGGGGAAAAPAEGPKRVTLAPQVVGGGGAAAAPAEGPKRVTLAPQVLGGGGAAAAPAEGPKRVTLAPQVVGGGGAAAAPAEGPKRVTLAPQAVAAAPAAEE